MNKKNNRNAQGAGSIRKKTVISKGKEYTYWEARYTAGVDPGTGKQVQKSVSGKTQKEVREKLQAVSVTLNEGTYTEPSKLTVSAWLDIWLSEYTGELKTLSLSTYTGHINNHIKPELGAVKLQALSTSQVQKLYNKLQKGSDSEEPIAPKTIKNIHGVLHKALAQAAELGYIKYNPAGPCKLPRIVKTEVKPLEEKQIALFLQAISGHTYERLYIVDLFTGLRQGEILGLTWDNVNFQAGTIHICKQLIHEKAKGGRYIFGTLKNDKTRLITPAPSVMRVLQEQKQIQTEWQLKAGPLWNDTGLVFTSEFGGHLCHVTVYKQFKRIAKNIGIPSARFHDLRHTYAVAALQSGDDVKTVQETLGHHTAAFTLDVYGHVSERMKKESAERMEQFIKGVRGA
ncbi:MAG: site-specific integrase [Bacillota bacterium]|nr:site-specific integrase [Bacillota bacterium]